MKKMAASLIAMVAMATSMYSHSQTKATPPPNSNPQWEAMGVVTFNADNLDKINKVPRPNNVDLNLARIVWGKEIAQNKDLPSFVLISSVNHNGTQYTFSILSSATAPGCIPPANGKNVTDIYSVCPIRVSSVNSSNQAKQGQFNGYCHVYPFAPEKAGDINQVQFWFDKANSVAYFRTIQAGQLVPACNKSIHVK